MTTLLKLLINAAALWAAARFIDGISYTGSWPGLVGLALVFGVVNTFIKPVLHFFSFPITVLTLGLFTLVINALMLMLTAWIATRLDIGFAVRGFVPALLGAICVSILSMLLGAILLGKDEKKRED
jgi:putative membrane protein